MQKNALNMMKHALYLKEAASVHHKAVASKVEILVMYLVAETHKIFLQTSLAAACAVDHAKVRIYKLRQQLHSANQCLEQHLICV
jgi:hypothetical protein